MANNILYRKEDIDAISSKMEEIIESASRKTYDTLEPTFKEYGIIFTLISNYIKKHKKIVYGGIALNEMLKNKNPNEVIYKDYTKNDIEIYSSDPVSDIKNICDMLNEKKFPYIEGKEADHPGTFTIFVNFDKYCDITYVPKIIYNNMSTIMVNGFRLIHPIYILTDTLRVYCDPLTSYRRLDKTFIRTNKLLSVTEFKPKQGQVKENTKYTYIIQELIPKIKDIKNIIFLDDIAYNYYLEQLSKKEVNESHIGIIMDDYKSNANKIYNILIDIIAEKDINYKEHLKIEEYHPFFQYWDHRIVIYYHNEPIVTLYKNNNRCLQYREIEKYGTKIRIGNFTLTLLFYMFHYHYNAIFKKSFEKYEYCIGNLLHAKNTYLTKHKLTSVDDSPYREFQNECLGDTVDSKRLRFLEIQKRLMKHSNLTYRYEPNSDHNSLTSDFKFPNEAGTVITNNYHRILKN
jgi:hypothetical protein